MRWWRAWTCLVMWSLICSFNRNFGITPAKLGLGYRLEDVALLIENISVKSAKELLFTGWKFSADDALRWGLISRISEPNDLFATVNIYVDEILNDSPLSVNATKVIIQEATKKGKMLFWKMQTHLQWKLKIKRQ